MFDFETHQFSEGADDLDLSVIVNEERLLHLALSVHGNDEHKQCDQEAAADIIIWYILRQYQKKKTKFTDAMLTDDFNEKVCQRDVDSLVEKGIMEVTVVDGEEPTYSLTPLGVEVLKHLKENDGS